MRVVGDEVGSNAHDDDRRYPVKHMISQYRRTVHAVGTANGSPVVIRVVCASHDISNAGQQSVESFENAQKRGEIEIICQNNSIQKVETLE